ncbi:MULTISPECIES: YciI-like protein [unclassified Curtobacterium]|uniref:YciI-like protein n=1 Tax=unclassified Curtobacterium TaxID=257496 RepID=UPI0030169CE4
MHAVLEYTYVDDYLERRDAFRQQHLRAAWAAAERGELLLGGAVGEGSGPFTALIVFVGDDALGRARAFAATDPYVTGGLVTSWTARPWTTVVGDLAAGPVRPD